MSPDRHRDPPSDDGDVQPARAEAPPACIALIGNPNTGKTTLFNRLCGVRSKTANFAGSTVEAHVGRLAPAAGDARLVDLPGIYGLNLDRPESRICRAFLQGDVQLRTAALGPEAPDIPDAMVIVLDATNLERGLTLASQALQQGLPAIVALNLVDASQRRGDRVDCDAISARLGCPVVPVSARTGVGVPDLVTALAWPVHSIALLPNATDARAAGAWAREVAQACVVRGPVRGATTTDRIDRICTHPIAGLFVFMAVMTALFYAIFALAALPMDLIEVTLAALGGWAGDVLPEGPIRDLVVDGVVGGVAGTLVFIPQICLLFFLISLLEDTGYLARAVFVVDRVLRAFGLPGQAFVPLLSAHACAIPAIMSTRLIPDRSERLATILVTPFLSCSARLPVYVLLVGILFADRPLLAGLAFTGCYALGAGAALVSAFIARRTVLPAPPRPMVLELPEYRWPSLRTALLTTFDRALMFLRKAGTVIMAICVLLWWLGAYPHIDPPPAATALRADAAMVATTDPAHAAELTDEADALEARAAMEGSFAGRIGRGVAPVFAPIGADWQLSIGVVTSFAAREVFVSTLAVVFSGADDAADTQVLDRIAAARRDDGSPLWTPGTAASLLVFYVLAMQCLPTLAVTAREAGSWKWAALQFAWMTAVAWSSAAIVHVVVNAIVT